MNKRQFTTEGSIDIEETIDLEQCHKKPIHRTELIMSHGIYLGFAPETMTIQSTSTNTKQWINQQSDDLIGLPLTSVLSNQLINQLKDTDLVDTDRKQRFIYAVDDTELIASVFPAGEEMGLELQERFPTKNTPETITFNVHQKLGEIPQITDLDRLHSYVLPVIRDLIDYDRVMLYQFNEDGHGQVLGEDKEADFHSYLGQQFPASDIPPPARRLYRLNTLRYIPTINYDPVPILGPDGKREGDELNLERSDLRNVPLVHREYLGNMKIEASVSIPIVVDDELWGLIACHNQSAKPIDAPRRDQARLIGQLVSQQISELEANKRNKRYQKLKSFQTKLEGSDRSNKDLSETLADHQDRILSFMDASAFLLKTEDQELWFHQSDIGLPPEDLLQKISERLEDANICYIRSIIDECEIEWDQSDKISGFLATRIGLDKNHYCVWFRPEVKETLKWGGDPRHPVQINDAGQLSPRNSFEEWTQIVTGRSKNWADIDRLTAKELARMFSNLLMSQQSHKHQQRNRILEDTKEKLEQSLRENQTLLSELNHRVKNNLQLVVSMIRLQLRGINNPETAEPLKIAQNRLESMATLHEILYQTENIERINVRDYFHKIISNVELVHDTADDIKVNYSISEMSLKLVKAIPCGLIINEAVFNAYEHAFEGKEGTIDIDFKLNGDRLKLSVADNGRGFPEGFDPAEANSLGLRLIRSLANEQLNGSYLIEDNDGVELQVEFSIEEMD